MKAFSGLLKLLMRLVWRRSIGTKVPYDFVYFISNVDIMYN